MATLNVEKFPNAAFDLLRTLVEKSIKSYADALQVQIPRSGKTGSGFVYLKECLEWVEAHFDKNGPRSLVQVVQKIRSRPLNYNMGNQGNMNAINHNHNVVASAQDVRDAWDAVEPLLAEVLK